LASIHAGHDAGSSAPAGKSFPITACAAQRGSTGFSVFPNGRLTIGDSMRELAFAAYFAMTFPPFTQSLWLLRAPFAPAELITSGAFCSAARHSIAPGFVCTFCRRFVLGSGEKQNAPANRSQTRKKIK